MPGSLSKKRVLFLCTGNTCRSAMAERLFKKRLKDLGIEGVEVRSAGVASYPGMPSPPEVDQALKPLGADAKGHASQLLTGELVDWADLILGMEAGHQMTAAHKFPRAVGKTYVLKSYAKAEGPRDIPDPIGAPPDVYAACAKDIAAALIKLMEKLEEKKT